MVKQKLKPKKGLKVLDHRFREIKGTITVPMTTYYSRLVKAGDLVKVETGKRTTNNKTNKEQ